MEKSNFLNQSIREKIAILHKALIPIFGIPVWKRKAPLDELMLTILSQNTNDKNRDNAYNRLRTELSEWEDVQKADITQIEQLIRPGGLSKQKSARMKAILSWILETFGGLTLEPLRDMDDDSALKLLTSQKGIGIKTAAVTLAFALDRNLCPVDTHVHRISKRLGWVGEKVSAEKTFHIIRPEMPRGEAAPFHLNLLRFGRKVCAARKPDCVACPVYDICVWEGKRK